VFPIKDNIPTDRFPVVTVALILANVLMYFIFQKGGILNGPSDSNVVRYGAIPYELTHPDKHCALVSGTVACEGRPGVVGMAPSQPSTYLTILTSMFMHGGILHLGGNMLFLWIFGNNVEDSMGPVKFILFYLVGGVAALALQTAVQPSSTVPTIGASGAIAAVLGGYIVLYPRARVLTVVFIIFFFTILELPAVVMLGIWFVEQALFSIYNLSSPTGGGGGGVAYFAHIGGFVFGLLAIRALAERRKTVPPRYPVY
jgi:membrane associated rhomboid family serine protease